MSKKGAPGKIAAAPAAAEGDPRIIMARLAGGVAHDLNNILLVLQGYTEIAAEEAEAAPGLQSLLGEMRAATARASALVRDLLVIGERGIFPPRHLDLSETISRRLPALQAAAPPGVVLRASLAPHLPPVFADEEQVARMVEALCARSREAMPTGGTLSIVTEPGPGAGRIILRIIDTGTPVSAETQAHLFEPYLPGPGGGKGQGLGLSVVQAVVRRIGGEVAVRARPVGTEIEVSLPSAEMHEPAAPGRLDAPPRREPALGAPAAPSGGAGGTILVAEDDDGLRALAAKVLGREGYTVRVARDGQEALEIFQEGPAAIRLVIMDDVMPRLGGRAALERVHARDPRCPLILCSGYDWRLTAGGPGVEADPWTMLSKPWQPRDLVKKVREVLE